MSLRHRNTKTSARHRAVTSIMSSLYSKSSAHREKVLNEIIKDNNSLHHSSKTYGQIIYKGLRFSSYTDGEYVEGYILKEELEPRMDKWIDEIEALEEEKRLIKNFLIRTFTVFDSKSDLVEILGENIFNRINKILFTSFTSSATDKILTSFINQNQEYITLMQERMISNLIMQDTMTGD
jgi:hypothetical protein